MKTIGCLFFCWIYIGSIISQQNWTGTYEGVLDGDNLTLVLEIKPGNKLVGKMTDSANSYDIMGMYSGTTFTGKALEKKLGLEFDMVSKINGDILNTTLSLNVFGTIEKMEISFTRKNTNTKQANKTTTTNKTSENNPVIAKSRDPLLIGTWAKESNYSSGYGFNDTYGSMSISEKMEFLSDGRVADGGGNTTVGGSNYTGTSSSSGKNIIKGLYWHTEGKKIYLTAEEAGKTQIVELGKYYIENKNLLITGTNGEKLLLQKK